MPVCVSPRWAKASFTAFENAGTPPTLGLSPTPSPHHPIGAKGVGESPNVGGVSAFSNAVNDAFAHLGLTHTGMPHDHWRVWKTAQGLGLTG